MSLTKLEQFKQTFNVSELKTVELENALIHKYNSLCYHHYQACLLNSGPIPESYTLGVKEYFGAYEFETHGHCSSREDALMDLFLSNTDELLELLEEVYKEK